MRLTGLFVTLTQVAKMKKLFASEKTYQELGIIDFLLPCSSVSFAKLTLQNNTILFWNRPQWANLNHEGYTKHILTE